MTLQYAVLLPEEEAEGWRPASSQVLESEDARKPLSTPRRAPHDRQMRGLPAGAGGSLCPGRLGAAVGGGAVPAAC